MTSILPTNTDEVNDGKISTRRSLFIRDLNRFGLYKLGDKLRIQGIPLLGFIKDVANNSNFDVPFDNIM